tara:strand:- start:11329 stop:11715 length:387 start_codon:yes stop_codon:yes gene_type:complete
MKYGYSKIVSFSFEETIKKLAEALASEGFGVLTTIDVKATLKKKLDVNYENYTILGACNPPLAHQALQAEKEIGLLLPCNVIVYETEGAVCVSAILPAVAMGMVDNEVLKDIAAQVEEKLKTAIDNLD